MVMDMERNISWALTQKFRKKSEIIVKTDFILAYLERNHKINPK